MLKSILAGAALVLAAPAAMAQAPASGTIVETAVGAPNLSTLVAAVQAAGLVDTLNGPGPFTVFAPTNDAFAKLPPGLVQSLLRPESKAALTSILTYHVVAGDVSAAALIKLIQDSGGEATLTTVQGAPLKASVVNGKVVLRDVRGMTSTVTATDVKAKNGTVHLIDSVVLPGSGGPR